MRLIIKYNWLIKFIRLSLAYFDVAKVRTLGWRSGAPRFESHPRLTFSHAHAARRINWRVKSRENIYWLLIADRQSNICGVSDHILHYETVYTVIIRSFYHPNNSAKLVNIFLFPLKWAVYPAISISHSPYSRLGFSSWKWEMKASADYEWKSEFGILPLCTGRYVTARGYTEHDFPRKLQFATHAYVPGDDSMVKSNWYPVDIVSSPLTHL